MEVRYFLDLLMGDGGQKGDPFNFAQNKRSLLEKIMRLDIDRTPGNFREGHILSFSFVSCNI